MKIGVLTGGGDCPGLNPAIRGVVLRALDFGDTVIGIEDGWAGLVKNITRPLELEDVEEILNKGGTILGTSRTNPFKKEAEDVPKVLENIKKIGLDGLVAIGGDDTLGVARKLYEKHKIQTVGVPKTMDNDLSATDFTFGFDTSVTVSVDALDRLRDTAKSHHRIMVLEVMGRYAGWVALYTGLAGGADWILLPEHNKDIKAELDAMNQHLKEVLKRGKRYALVAVSEGVELPVSGSEGEQMDSFGHKILKEKRVGESVAKLIKEATGVDTRASVIGHIQRGGSPTVFDRVLGTRVGVKAVEMLHNNEFGKMACLIGTEIKSVDLSKSTGEQKLVSQDWIKLSKALFK